MEENAPLTEGFYNILLALYEPRHGYGIMQFVSKLSNVHVELGPGNRSGVNGLFLWMSLTERRNIS